MATAIIGFCYQALLSEEPTSGPRAVATAVRMPGPLVDRRHPLTSACLGGER